MFELVFVGGTAGTAKYTRKHDTLEAAEKEAFRVLVKIANIAGNRDAHPAIIYGPGCGRDGRTIR